MGNNTKALVKEQTNSVYHSNKNSVVFDLITK